MYVVQQKNLLGKYQKGAQIMQTTLASGASTADALIADQIDIGVQAIPPFLIAWDKGVDFRIAAGLAYNPVHLVTWRKDINALKDFKPGDKIALPSPTSGEAIFLSYQSKKDLGNASALKQNFVALSEPDSQAALTAHQIAAHFATLPYYQQELAIAGNHEITTDAQIAAGEQLDALTRGGHGLEPPATMGEVPDQPHVVRAQLGRMPRRAAPSSARGRAPAARPRRVRAARRRARAARRADTARSPRGARPGRCRSPGRRGP